MVIVDFGADLVEFGKTLGWYTSRKLRFLGDNFESAKGLVVDILKARRGTYQKPFLHVGMVFLMVTVILLAPIIATEYPSAFAASDSLSIAPPPSAILSAADITNMDTVTKESEKPRKEVLNYTVKGGDTLSGVAKAYGVDVDSIVYLNDYASANKVLKPGDVVKIPPVSGVIVKVKSGDTIASLAKKYGLASSQSIVDWPYNEFANDETFALSAGQSLVIPGGKAPEDVPLNLPVFRTPQTMFAGGSGQFGWPTQGIITQYYSSYHSGLDIASGIGTPVLAADAGRVESVIYEKVGYGIHIIVNHGNGLKTLYGHLSRVSVAEGQNVGRGDLLGDMGSTGRSTGPHLHFEIMSAVGARTNPLSFLK